MEDALLMRVISSSVMALHLSTGAVVSTSLEKGLPPADLHCLSKASALKPIPVRVKLGPYSLNERCFTQCRLEALQAPAVQPAVTTRYRRIS